MLQRFYYLRRQDCFIQILFEAARLFYPNSETIAPEHVIKQGLTTEQNNLSGFIEPRLFPLFTLIILVLPLDTRPSNRAVPKPGTADGDAIIRIFHTDFATSQEIM